MQHGVTIANQDVTKALPHHLPMFLFEYSIKKKQHTQIKEKRQHYLLFQNKACLSCILTLRSTYFQ